MKKFIISCLSKKGWSQLKKRRLSPFVSTLLGTGIISSYADGGSELFPVRSWTSPVVRSLPIGNGLFVFREIIKSRTMEKCYLS